MSDSDRLLFLGKLLQAQIMDPRDHVRVVVDGNQNP